MMLQQQLWAGCPAAPPTLAPFFKLPFFEFLLLLFVLQHWLGSRLSHFGTVQK